MARHDHLTPIGGSIGNAYPLSDGDVIDNRTLTQHAFVPVVEQQATKKRWYHVGRGIEHADRNVGRFSVDLQVADDDGGTNQANAKGTGRWAVYPDEPDRAEPKATGDEYTLAELRDADANDHDGKLLLPAMKPGVQQDEYAVFEVQIDSSQEGKQVYQEGSSFNGVLSERKV